LKAIQFTNFSTEDFTWKWDGIPYTFPAGSTMFLEDYKAEHFAQHLVDRELNRKNVPTNNMMERAKLGKLCFPTLETITPLEAMQRNEGKTEDKKDDTEEEFAGLRKEPVVRLEVVADKEKKEKKEVAINRKEPLQSN